MQNCNCVCLYTSVKLTVAVSENGLEREELLCVLRQLHNEELCDLHWSPNVTTGIKTRGMRWVGHVACIWRREMCSDFEFGSL